MELHEVPEAVLFGGRHHLGVYGSKEQPTPEILIYLQSYVRQTLGILLRSDNDRYGVPVGGI